MRVRPARSRPAQSKARRAPLLCPIVTSVRLIERNYLGIRGKWIQVIQCRLWHGHVWDNVGTTWGQRGVKRGNGDENPWCRKSERPEHRARKMLRLGLGEPA
jgi:hypothetical protein